MARDGGKRRRPPADAPAMMSLGTPGRREAAPLNAYPFWKYLFVLLVIVAGPRKGSIRCHPAREKGSEGAYPKAER